MTDGISGPYCSTCSTPVSPGARVPCPQCGETMRSYKAAFTATGVGTASMRLKARRPGVKDPIAEGRYEPSVQRTTGLVMNLERFIDRLRNSYHEKVTNPKTGEVVHQCDEPLSNHQGHGSAKRKTGA